MIRKRNIDKRISGFITQLCTLDPEHWTGYSELYGLYTTTSWMESDEQLTRREFIQALRTVPGFRAVKRGLVAGCYGLLLDESAPQSVEDATRAFRALVSAFHSEPFKYDDVARLARTDQKLAKALCDGGCMKPTNHRCVRNWLMACRDRRHAGHVLRRVLGDKDPWRQWRLEKSPRKTDGKI